MRLPPVAKPFEGDSVQRGIKRENLKQTASVRQSPILGFETTRTEGLKSSGAEHSK